MIHEQRCSFARPDVGTGADTHFTHALSVQQPWATLLVGGGTRYLARGWRTFFRGTLAIQASRLFSRENIELCCAGPIRASLRRQGLDFAMELPTSAFVGTADLVDCLYLTPQSRSRLDPTDVAVQFGVLQPGRWVWIFRDPVRFPQPVPMAGRLGLFRVPKTALPT